MTDLEHARRCVEMARGYWSRIPGGTTARLALAEDADNGRPTIRIVSNLVNGLPPGVSSRCVPLAPLLPARPENRPVPGTRER